GRGQNLPGWEWAVALEPGRLLRASRQDGQPRQRLHDIAHQGLGHLAGGWRLVPRAESAPLPPLLELLQLNHVHAVELRLDGLAKVGANLPLRDWLVRRARPAVPFVTPITEGKPILVPAVLLGEQPRKAMRVVRGLVRPVRLDGNRDIVVLARLVELGLT